MLATIVNGLVSLLGIILQFVTGLLPLSPFHWDFSWLGEWWPTVNYFIPFQGALSMLITWLVAVGLWYGVRWLLRLARYIQ